MIKIVIADDHPTFIDGLKGYFDGDIIISVEGITVKADEVLDLIRQTEADILLLDYSFGFQNMTGIDICKKIKEQKLKTRVIVISGFFEQHLVYRFIESGAMGYLLKSSTKAEYIEAIKNVYLGIEVYSPKVRDILLRRKIQNSNEPVFSRSELEIIGLIGRGLTTKEISRKLFRSKNTIDSHRKNILSKFHAMDKDENKSLNIVYYIAKFDMIKKYNL
ncbi:MAG: response regulator transcription factor [Bacteroidetes bacterium]|nr:response regulator transcription factor [Bacteroidota bacterium]